ncbi:unnamed protein product [Parascedosporium putredinis]|uniref:Ankyrin n=1 Tax=Parascedosporium putredinis TaxID=1442378 RepID=A0A9P1GZJ6_9PEZI|nr:unnamed protein product [Parascedosporium putredinis]CAI7991863.1 unnamed protein product [Parascedosporium putredinis]
MDPSRSRELVNLDDLPSDLDEVRALVDQRLGGAVAAQKAHHESPALASKVGRKAQGILEKLSVYLTAYGELISLASSSDPIAGTACQALSMLVLINLRASEIQISHDIHRDDDDLSQLIRVTYHKTYVFSVQASYYYLAPRWRRIFRGIAEPPEVGVKNAADELDGVIRDVRARCGILTQRRIRDIEVRLIKVEKYTEDTFKLEEDSAVRSDLELLRSLERKLRHKLQDDASLRMYRSDLAALFDLLLVSGETEEHQEMHCWLSPGLFSVCDARKSLGGDTVLLFCCRGSSAFGRVGLKALLTDLIYQLLAADPTCLRDDAIRKALPGSEEGSGSRARASSLDDISVLKSLFTKLVGKRGRVWLFIDRVDWFVNSASLLKTLGKVMAELDGGPGEDCLKVFALASSDAAEEFKLTGRGEEMRTASVTSVLKLTSKVVQDITSAQDAEKHSEAFLDELCACGTVLQQLKKRSDDVEAQAWRVTTEALEAPGAPLGRLHTLLHKQKELEEISEVTQREKSLLQLALVIDSQRFVREIEKSAPECSQQLMTLLSRLQDGQDSIPERTEESEQPERLLVFGYPTRQDYAARHNDALGRRQPSTGQWFLEHPKFSPWLEKPRETLFCPGIPGAGKTILTSIVIEDLLNRFKGRKDIGLAYIYCDLRRRGEQTPCALSLNLMRQLTRGREDLPAGVNSRSCWRPNAATICNFHHCNWLMPPCEDVEPSLNNVITHLYSRTFIIIDAVDELGVDDDHRSEFLARMLKLQAKCGINLLVTSRPVPDIAEVFKASITLEIRAREHNVRRFLDANISQLPPFVQQRPDLQEEAIYAIVGAVDGRFLLARLHLESLVGEKSIETLQHALSALPVGPVAYDRAYDEVLKRIESQASHKARLAKQALSWITRATRLLRDKELQHALAVEKGQASLNVDRLPDIADIVSSCGGLVLVDKKSGIVRLIHHTAHDYFTRTWKKCVLGWTVFMAVGARGGKAEKQPAFPLRRKNWAYHATQAENVGQYVLDFLHRDVNVEAERTPLIWAAMAGNEEIFKLVLETGLVDVNSADVDGLTPLAYAAMGAMTPSSDSSWRPNPLAWAAKAGKIEVVNLLLEIGNLGVDGSPRSDDSLAKLVPSLLMGAGPGSASRAATGKELLTRVAGAAWGMMVQLVQGKGHLSRSEENRLWDLDSNDRKRTPLSLAAESGHETLVRLLLDRGADINLGDVHERTALSWAAGAGREAIVLLLLVRGADPDTVDERGRTPLSWAAEVGQEMIVQLLLSRKVDVNAPKGTDRGPLGWAAVNGYETIVRLLLERGADVNPVDTSGPPLLLAAEEGRATIVELLIAGEPMSIHGRTPISWAAALASEPIVRLLLDANSDVDPVDKAGMTPLARAAGACVGGSQ